MEFSKHYQLHPERHRSPAVAGDLAVAVLYGLFESLHKGSLIETSAAPRIRKRDCGENRVPRKRPVKTYVRISVRTCVYRLFRVCLGFLYIRTCVRYLFLGGNYTVFSTLEKGRGHERRMLLQSSKRSASCPRPALLSRDPRPSRSRGGTVQDLALPDLALGGDGDLVDALEHLRGERRDGVRGQLAGPAPGAAGPTLKYTKHHPERTPNYPTHPFRASMAFPGSFPCNRAPLGFSILAEYWNRLRIVCFPACSVFRPVLFSLPWNVCCFLPVLTYARMITDDTTHKP